MRLTVRVPPEADPVYARQLAKGLEEHLQGGAALIMLRRPPGIRDEDMPIVVAKCAALLEGAAFLTANYPQPVRRRRGRLERFLLAHLTG